MQTQGWPLGSQGQKQKQEKTGAEISTAAYYSGVGEAGLQISLKHVTKPSDSSAHSLRGGKSDFRVAKIYSLKCPFSEKHFKTFRNKKVWPIYRV